MSDVRAATPDDIPELVRLRGVLVSIHEVEFGPPPTGNGWEDACAKTLADELAGDAMRIAVIDGALARLAACGMGVIDRRLPTAYNPGGAVGHVFGIVTDPPHRRRGHARAIMTDLLDWFDERGLKRVDLYASAEGRPLYRSLGFGVHPEPVLTRLR
jgi:ribosomal protein S18 acetylase RimI-like enzyme